MKFGINLDVDSDFLKFAKIVEEVGIDVVKIHVDISLSMTEIKKIANKLKKLNVKSYITFLKADPNLFVSWGDKVSKIQEILPCFTKKQILGVGLPEEIHTILRRGTSRRGTPKNVIVDGLNSLSNAITDLGYKVVMPMRIDDAQGDLWSQIAFDVYDIEVFIARNAVHAISKLQVDKPVWAGKAGKYGGYVAPSQQKNTLERIKREAQDICEYAFIFSDKNIDKFHWSKDQTFNIASKEMVRLNGEEKIH